MLKIIIAYSFCFLLSPVMLQSANLNVSIDGVYVSRQSGQVFEFDALQKVVTIERLSSRKMETYEYQIIGNKIYFKNDKENYHFEIIKSKDQVLHLNYRLMDIDMFFYKVNYEFDLDAIAPRIQDSYLKMNGAKPIEGYASAEHLILSVTQDSFQNIDTWDFYYDEYLFPIVNINSVEYLVLDYSLDRFTLGTLWDVHEVVDLIVQNEDNENSFDLNGGWYGNVKFDSETYKETAELTLTIIDDSVNVLPYLNVVEFIGDSHMMFKIVESDEAIILKHILSSNEKTKHKLGRFVGENISLELGRVCDF